MREPAVMLAHSIRGWAQELHFFLMDHGGALVRGYVMSPEDAANESYDVLVVDDVTSFLSTRLVGNLQRSGVRVIGVYDATDPAGAGKQRLLELGVDEALADTTPPAEFVETIARIAGPMTLEDPALEGLFDAIAASPSPVVPDTGKVSPRRQRRGYVIAVAAASGGAGATEIAVGLAVGLRTRDQATVLVDADEQAPSVAQRLGLGVHPNIRTAVDAVHHGTAALNGTLTNIPVVGISILSGLPNPRDWFELRSGEVVEVIAELAKAHPYIVANVGPRIEDLPETSGPARFAVTRATLSLSDVVVLVGSATPIGVTRIVDWLADGRALVTGKPLHIVLNQHPGSSFVSGEIEAELRRTVAPQSITVVPFDKRVTRAAWDGVPVGRGPFSKATARLTRLIPVFDEARP
jgi:MinD-like ATPase involved in chromosome partitioning or flagellar assembly